MPAVHTYPIAFLLGAALLVPVPARTAAAEAPAALPPKLDASVERGLTFLARQQNANGSFGSEKQPRAALTGLALLAFLGAGHTPDVGKFGLGVQEAVDWLVGQVPPDGYVGGTDGSRMYGQGIVTLALAEAYGVEPQARPRQDIRAALVRLVKVIVEAQGAADTPEPFAGGWRYEPGAADADLSLSGWNALALRAAQQVGVEVRPEAVARAVAFVRRCYHKDQHGFAYQPGGPAVGSMTGVGVLALSLLATDETPAAEIEAAGRWLVEHPPKFADTEYPYYTFYYVTHAAYQSGDDAKSLGLARGLLERLIRVQEKDGGWPAAKGEREFGRAYATAMAVLTLTSPYRLLPAYQR